MDRKRPFWQSLLLHAALISGSVVFALPFVWMVGTSFKLDKEIQTERISIMPRAPQPRPVSPYVDDRQFAIERPERVGRHRWDGWMSGAVADVLGAVVDAWNDPREPGLDADTLRSQLVAGVFQRVRNILPPAIWESDESTFRQALAAAARPEHVEGAFEAAYRYAALGKVLLKDRQYRIHDLTAATPIEQLWSVTSGDVRIVPRMEADRPVAVLAYDLREKGGFELTAMLPLPVPLSDFKRLDLSLRRDETWHELRVLVEAGGRLLRAASPKYLGDDTWTDQSYQEPSHDDKSLTPRRYILLHEVARGPQYDHGPDRMKLRIEIKRSSTAEAYWAKSTENYRRVFDEVPFWRYLSTSAFLAIMNIVGGAVSCSLAAYALARLRWPGRELCFYLVLATLMIPPQITMIPSFVIYRYLGWYNTLAPLWAPSWLGINAFGIFLLRQAMKGIPRDLEDAARIDGCGFLRTYWHVAMPLMKPTLAVISVFTFLYVWNDFLGPLIYVNDQRLYPLALGLFSFLAGRENQFAWIMAGALVMTVPVVLIFFFAQRYFIQGVTLTGVKG